MEQAKADVKSAGGEVLHQFKTGNRGFIVTLPDDQFQALEAKDYVDFVEADQESKFVVIDKTRRIDNDFFFSAHLKMNQTMRGLLNAEQNTDDNLPFSRIACFKRSVFW